MPTKKTTAKKPAAGTHKMPGGHKMSDAQMKAMAKKKMPMMAGGGRIPSSRSIIPEDQGGGLPYPRPVPQDERRGREAALARREKRRGETDDIVSSQPPGRVPRKVYALAKGGTIKAKAKPKKR